MRVIINSISDITSQISYPGLSVTQQLSSTVDTANFTVRKYGNKTFTPAFNDDVEIYDGTTKIFGGKIIEINESTESLPNEKIYQISCVDHTYELDSILVARTYTNKTISEIIADMISDFTPAGSGFTSSNALSTFLITKIVFNQIPISQCIRKLADIVKYEWYVDENKDVHFFPKFAETAPFNMTDGNYIIKSYQKGIDGSQIVNRVKVRGGLYDGSTFTDIITVNGDETKSFKLPYKFANLSIEVNGTPQTVGIDFVDDFTSKDVLYNYQDQSFHFESPLSNADEIEYSGNPKIPVLAIAEDSDSIDSFGVKEKLIKDNAIVSNTTARRRASAELLVYADSILDGRFSTYTSGLRAGQVITTPEGDNMLIKTLKFNAYTPLEFKYDISLISTQRYDLLDILRKIVAPENEDIDENEVSEQIYTVNETLSIQDDIQKIDPYVLEETVEIEEDIIKDAVAPDNIKWVYGFYAPKKRMVQVTIDHTKVAGDLTDYPAYLDLSLFGDDFWDYVSNGGGDIRIYSADKSSEYAREIVSCNTTTKTGEVYTKLPNVSSSVDTVFYVVYGDSSMTDYARTDTYGSDNVWGDYEGIWHLKEGTGTVIADSSPNANDGEIVQPTMVTWVDGKIGKGIATNNDTTRPKARVPTTSADFTAGPMTMTTWFEFISATAGDNVPIFDRYSIRLYLSTAREYRFVTGRMNDPTTGPTRSVSSGVTATADGIKHQIKGVYFPDPVGGTGYLKIYVDGILKGTASITTDIIAPTYGSGTSGLAWGTSQHGVWQPTVGEFDESSIASFIQTDQWISTEYNNQSSPSGFYSFVYQDAIYDPKRMGRYDRCAKYM